MSDPLDYTVGWICALNTEYVAAKQFLDEVHEAPRDRSPADNNTYTLGRIGRHNVVIAVLPDGEYGTSSASIAASDMQHTFRNVRIGLMVGIGGGAPYLEKRRDIRLGDVVVSSTVNGKSCVLQYDFGKRIQGQKFKPTGFLNQPPRILRSAISQLKAKYEEEGNGFEDAIDNLLKKKPRLKRYRRPDPLSDRLYRSSYVHPEDNEAGCSATCTDPSNMIGRSPREEDEDNPMIHYGRIASANSLMKDAVERDYLANDEDILCFEMEAAGLMNNFPCLVIRGICDYSDSHKNKEWQGFAAMTAAAYAKDILLEIVPAEVVKEKKIVDVLLEVQEGVGTIALGVEKILRRQDDEHEAKILNWITPVDYALQQIDFFKRRQEGTCEWFLRSEEFQKWVKTSNQKLFCPGIPGAGKTYLFSIVVHYLVNHFQNNEAIEIAYIYFNYRRNSEQQVDDLLASILRQLSQNQSSFPLEVKTLYDRYKGKSSRPDTKEMLATLNSIAAKYSRLLILVDALDESALGNGLESFIKQVSSLKAKEGTSLLATSRPNTHAQSCFQDSLIVNIRADAGDVEKYLESQLYELPAFVTGNKELTDKVKTEILSMIDGMFLLAYFYLRALIGVPSRKVLLATLEDLRETADGYNFAYESAMKRVQRQVPFSRDLAKKVLSWISRALRPLTLLEVQHAIAIEPDTLELAEDNIPETDLVSICAGLITIDESTQVIRLVHYTTQEYFDKNWTKWFPEAERYIADSCLTYLWYDAFKSGPRHFYQNFKKRLQNNVLYGYVANFWARHVCLSELEEDQRVLWFLQSEGHKLSCYQVIQHARYDHGEWSANSCPNSMPALSFAAYMGLAKAAKAILGIYHGANVNEIGYSEKSRTPLYWAAERSHLDVVRVLLENGADPNLIFGNYTRGPTPLIAAARNGNEAILNILLDYNADYTARDWTSATPLSVAVSNGRSGIVKILLEKAKHIDIDNICGLYGYHSLLLASITKNDFSTAKLLLDAHGIKAEEAVFEEWFRERNPLLFVTEQENEELGKLVLNHSLNITDERYYKPAITHASEYGFDSMLKMILDHLAILGLDKKYEFYNWALDGAMKGANGKAVLLWLENGESLRDVKFYKRDSYGYGVLPWAALRGDEAVMRFLLDRGAKVGTEEALAAAENENSETSKAVMRTFLERGVDIETRNHYGCTLLLVAAARGTTDTVELLLDMGADIEARDKFGNTPLLQAALMPEERIAIIQLLLQRGADIQSLDSKGRNALSHAARSGNVENLKIILAQRPDLEVRDRLGRTALSFAASSGSLEKVLLLIDAGADIETKCNRGGTPLVYAVARGKKAVELGLLDKSADAFVKDKQGRQLLTLEPRGVGSKLTIMPENSDAECEQRGFNVESDHETYLSVSQRKLPASSQEVLSAEYPDNSVGNLDSPSIAIAEELLREDAVSFRWNDEKMYSDIEEYKRYWKEDQYVGLTGEFIMN